MAESNVSALYLCLLDDIELSSETCVGRFRIRSYSRDDLARLLREREDIEPTAAELKEFERLSEFPWASIERPVQSSDQFRERFPDCAGMSDFDSEHLNAIWRGQFGDPVWPFRKLLTALNLFKASSGPVFARHMYLRPAHEIQTKRQVIHLVHAEPDTTFYGMEEGPCPCEYKLEPNDQGGLSDLLTQLERCVFTSSPDLDNTHLRVAVQYFRRGDECLLREPAGFEAIEPLMAYESGLEALLIAEEHKGNIAKALAARVGAMFGPRLGEIRETVRSAGGRSSWRSRSVAPEELKNFVRRIFWLRSKFAHGARRLEELERLILSRPQDGTNGPRQGDKIPCGPYSRILLDGGYFPGFLVNARELARRVIRHFLDEFDRGHAREQTLDALTAEGGH